MKARRILLTLLAVGLLLGGCTSGVVFDRMAVNDSLRAACPWLPDANIKTLLTGMDYDRETGYTKAEETQIIMDVCGADPNPASCMVCSMAVLEQVYGE